MTSPIDLFIAADENLVVQATWATSLLPGTRVLSAPDLVLVDSGLPCDTYNFVCRARLTAVSAERRVREALAFFDHARRPFSWWLGPGYTPTELPTILTRCGLHEAESEVAMVMKLARLPPVGPAAPGLSIARVRTPEDLDQFAELSAANWDPPDPHVLRYFAMASSVLLDPAAPLWLYLGWVDGRAVATAQATIGGGVVGLYTIGTHPDFRRRGIALAMTWAPLAEAREAGWTTAILQAAPPGVSVYERLGFRSFGTVTEFKPGPVHP